ncbi:MAG: 16S rRNA (cytosine(1402)-N(4))-methyltransferase RsmH [Flavobacteriia bacterium]|nr:16S rRNA (cytosine(1402)-N(4))-methyltransferase RsmH [Flavobacteriia bacterium]
MRTNTNYHIPVLLRQSVEQLDLKEDALVVDATFGGGGHSSYMLTKLSSKGFLYAFDQDLDAVPNAFNVSNFKLIQANFKFLKNHLAAEGVTQVDAILADIGVSSHQFDAAERGFSFRYEAPLDMRMNQRAGKTAAAWLNESSEEELLRVFNTYSDLNNVYKLVQHILKNRDVASFKTTSDLNRICLDLAPKHKEHKYIAQVFQAIRVEINDEVGALKSLLKDASEVLRVGGRISVISYHSIEDRLVKNFFKKGDFEAQETKDFFGNLVRPFKEINRHPIVPDALEIEENNRARSAKLRTAERI